MKSGFIAIVGRPNVGKSSLLNKIIGEKVTIVTPKPQTTRRRITGIMTDAEAQLIFTDTPGIFKPRNNLGEFMMKEVKAASTDTDIVMLVLDAVDGITPTDFDLIEQYKNALLIVALNKIDLAGANKVFPALEKLGKIEGITEIIPISALKGDNVVSLIDTLKKYVTDDIKYYPDEQTTDMSKNMRLAEIIREKAMMYTQQEIPHGIAVEIERYSDDTIAQIEALIICEKDSHKGIIIGAKGSMLKKIGSSARVDLEKFLGKKVFLTMYVKVIKDWRERKNILDDMGYKS